jgi:4-hydroxy-3-polyprenylbenzoate decarboxylase
LFWLQNKRRREVNMRMVVGISGASGAVYGVRLLERLRARPQVETHLVMSRAGEKTAFLELGLQAAEIRAMAHHSYSIDDIGCRLASGSIHTMSAIASGISSNLLVRAADVSLKERRRLILMVRETPLHLGHLKTMVSLTEMGAIVAPPVPGFYHRPQSVDELVDHSVDRVLDLLGLAGEEMRRWEGP